MSTWISKALCLLALAGCVEVGSSATRPGQVAVLGGKMTVAMPPNYCIDTSSLTDTGDTVVAIAGRCDANRPAVPALITVSLGADGSSAALKPGAQRLTDWARSPAGRAALASDGRASSVAVRETLVSDGVFLIRLEDRKLGAYWRAALPLRGRLVMISVTASEGDLPLGDGRRIAEQVAQALRRANQGG